VDEEGGKLSYKTLFAEELLNRITDDKFELHQGVTTLISGGMGSGKTTLLLHLLDYLFADGRELLFWRGREVDQWHHADERVEFRVFHYYKDRIRFEGEDEIKQYYELEPYRNVREIFEKASLDRVNVVYPPARDWKAEYSDDNLLTIYKEYKQSVYVMEEEFYTVRHGFWYSFIYEMLKLRDFSSLFFDEFDDIAERYAKGFKYHMITFLMNALRYFRQKRLSLYGATQVVTDIDSRILGKIMYFIYMAGAKVHRESVLDAKKVKFAELGHAFIEERNTGTFAKFTYPSRGIISPFMVSLEEEGKKKEVEVSESEFELGGVMR